MLPALGRATARARTAHLWDGALLVATKVAISLGVVAGGFRAVSDDDYARIVLAQRFAEAPALDPSGSSWLPLPFWLYGAAFALFGNGLEVARAVAVALGTVSVLLVWLAARVLGVGRLPALAAGLIAALFPYSAYLGAAAVPEAPASAAVVFGAATLASGFRWRLAGGALLAAACASRYEPWPAALVFSALTALDARRLREPRLIAAAALASLFVAAWLAHGLFRHGDALFFVERVTSYRAALGPDSPFFERLLRTPRGFFGAEPELVLSTLVLGAAVFWGSRRAALPSGLRRGSVCIAALALGLIAGDLGGGAPTHHGERALLAAWFWCALLLSSCSEALRTLSLRARLSALGAALVSMAVALFVVRPGFAREPFANREAEVELGARARSRALERLAIDAPDFGYFAITASFGRPTVVLDELDPRRARARDLLAESPESLALDLRARGIGWLALPSERVHLARSIGVPRERNTRWTLVELVP